ncbi:MAG: PAAR domain-containing protein [Gammaproteobacteria bacterium]
MAGPVIVLGDKTSHGGTVIEASTMTDIAGKGVARMGDKTSCPIPGHGTNPIVTGDQTCIIDGKPVARHGDKTSCGATLIASQQTTVDLI